jgi:hypothetical protein
MSRGGHRPGAGRPLGAVARINREVREKAIATGETPPDYMLRVMRDESATKKRRDDMAKAAAPFVHARVSPVAAEAADGTMDLSKLSDAELDALERIRAFSGLTESAGFSLCWICDSTFVSNRHGGCDGQAIFSGLA